MEFFSGLISDISGLLWGAPMIVLLFGTHLFLTIRLRFPQRYIFKAIRLSLAKDKYSSGDVSHFGALSTSLAATIGTGNIIGVGTAIALGGPGAVFWCWLTGMLGIATKYAEGLLAVKYRVKTGKNEMKGGPMYAIENGLAKRSKGIVRWFWKFMAIAFAFFTSMATFGIGSTVQANTISTMSSEFYGISPIVVGIVITVLSAAVIMGGLKSIANFCKTLVPLMAGFYIIGCVFILCCNASFVWPSIKLIFESAFNPSAAGGGFVGSTIIMTARYGIARGLFSNESGMGSAPIIAASARTKNPVRQALVSSSATFWDTVVICALTGLTLVSTILKYPDIIIKDGGNLTMQAFGKIPYIGETVLVVGAITFAFSTVLGWGLYGERGIEYLCRKSPKLSKRAIIVFRIIYLISVYLGAVVSLELVWNMADIFNALMAIPNLLCLLFLSGVIVNETKKYLWNNKLDDDVL